MILGEMQEDFQDKGRLVLVREDQTVDGAREYVIVHNDSEIERVIGHFAMNLLMDHIDQLPPEIAEDLRQMNLEMQEDELFCDCGCTHQPGEFCFCGDFAYLQ